MRERMSKLSTPQKTLGAGYLEAFQDAVEGYEPPITLVARALNRVKSSTKRLRNRRVVLPGKRQVQRLYKRARRQAKKAY